MIELNCKVVKKWQPSPPPPISTSAPPFQVYPPILAKNFVPPNVILMSLLLTVTHCCSVFLLTLNMLMTDGILYCLHLNLYISESDLGTLSPNNSFQRLPIFCHKELHLRCCIGLGYCILYICIL